MNLPNFYIQDLFEFIDEQESLDFTGYDDIKKQIFKEYSYLINRFDISMRFCCNNDEAINKVKDYKKNVDLYFESLDNTRASLLIALEGINEIIPRNKNEHNEDLNAHINVVVISLQKFKKESIQTILNYFFSLFLFGLRKDILIDIEEAKINIQTDLLNHIKDHKEEAKKRPNNLLYQGVKFNISERYKLINEVLDAYNIISKKNISATDKHKFIGYILGCQEQTARNLFNGMHQKRTPVRNEIINEYLKELK